MRLQVVPCTLRKANDFVEVFHRHSKRTARNGGKFAIAAAVGTVIVGVAIVGNPLSATYMDGFTAEVLRVCVCPLAPKNCNSFLYGACRRIWFEMGGRKLLTYTLLTESGISLQGAGWDLVATIKGHSATTWGKQDHLVREGQPIFGVAKNRWETFNSDSAVRALEWPNPIEAAKEERS